MKFMESLLSSVFLKKVTTCGQIPLVNFNKLRFNISWQPICWLTLPLFYLKAQCLFLFVCRSAGLLPDSLLSCLAAYLYMPGSLLSCLAAYLYMPGSLLSCLAAYLYMPGSLLVPVTATATPVCLTVSCEPDSLQVWLTVQLSAWEWALTCPPPASPPGGLAANLSARQITSLYWQLTCLPRSLPDRLTTYLSARQPTCVPDNLPFCMTANHNSGRVIS
jgi:hypothetical protein